MKKLSLLFILISGIVFGQTLTSKKLDSLQFENVKSQILAATGKTFKPVQNSKLDWKDYTKYQNEADESDVLYIIYFTKMEGENKDLEKKGVKQWNLDAVASKYLTIYELYKKFYNPKADLEKIQKMGQDWNAPTKEAAIRKTSQPNLWEVKFW